MGADDGPPPARSARVRPNRLESHSSRNTNARTSARHERGDPRFDPMLGRVNRTYVAANYKFLQEREAAEEEQRRFRIRCLRCALRRFELEDAGADTAEYDLTDEENEVFGEEHREDLALLKLTPTPHVRAELEELQRASQLYRSRTRDQAATARRKRVKGDMIKREVRAVKDGAKTKPYFPKRSELKRAELGDTFDRLQEKGGQAAVKRYVARKGMRH